MKDFLKNFFKGSSIGLGIVLVLGISYLAIKARVATNPGISDTTPGSLYVNNNETLTAAKRNSMIASTKSNYQKVSLTNGDYQTTTSATAVPGADITMTTSASPVLITATIPIKNGSSSTADGAYCGAYVDGVLDGGWVVVSVATSRSNTLNFSYITDNLSAGSHNFKLYCRSGSGYIKILKNTTNSTKLSVLELKQ